MLWEWCRAGLNFELFRASVALCLFRRFQSSILQGWHKPFSSGCLALLPGNVGRCTDMGADTRMKAIT